MPTTNPVPSTDPTDLLFNAGKLDEVVNGASASYTDRLGVSRRSLSGIDAAADNVLNAIGYSVPVAYASGISLTLTSQTVDYNGVVYAPKSSALPFTTSSWGVDSAKFRAVQVTDADLITYTPAGTGAVATTVQSKLREIVSVKDFGAVGDVVTDDTAAILAAAVNSGKKFFIIPYGVKYDRAALLAEASFPDDVVLLDFSGINDFSAPGETTKHFGIVSKGSAPDDTHWAIDSGHHSIFALNNYGTAGTTSAAERKATLIWNVGQYANGAVQNKGFRGAALLQFTKEASSNYWIYQLRSLAPWVSIANQYEEWRSGEVITNTSTYRISNGQQYVAASTGTTGGTAPVHTSGTVSDGGVSWAWVDSGDRSVFNVRQDGRWLLGGGVYDATWRHKVSIADPAGAYVFEGEATGVSKSSNLKLIPTDSGGTAIIQPFLRSEVGGGLRVMKTDASTDLGSWTDDGGYLAREFRTTWGNAADADTTPSVSGGITTLWIANTGATSITALDDGSDGQIVHLVFANANTTLVSSATLLMQGSVNVTPTQYSVVTMMKVPNSISDRWIEVSRSIK